MCPLQWEHGVLTTGLPGNSCLNILYNCKCFQGGCAILHSHQKCMRGPVPPYPHQHLLLLFLFLLLLPSFHFSLSCIGGKNGNPLQCSCLENPRDRGAWWAAVYGVAQSRTRLKRLSSSSSSGREVVSLLLICISQMINDGEQLFLCVLATCVSSSEKSLVHSFACVKMGLYILLLNVVFFTQIVYQR